MKYITVIPTEVTEWVANHPFNSKTFTFSAHALKAEYRQYDVAMLPLRKPSRFNGAMAYAYRAEGARREGDPNWTIRLRKSGRDNDYIVVASPKADGSWVVVSYWPVHAGAPDTDDFTKDGEEYVPDHKAHGPLVK